MNKYLIKLANHLDQKGLYKEASYVDWIIKKSSSEEKEEKAMEEIKSFIEKIKTFVKKYSNIEGPGQGYVLDLILRDFERYLSYLNNPDEDNIDMSSINMMIKEYPETALLEKESKIKVISNAIELIKDVIDPHRNNDLDFEFHDFI